MLIYIRDYKHLQGIPHSKADLFTDSILQVFLVKNSTDLICGYGFFIFWVLCPGCKIKTLRRKYTAA